jgi:hypothetical protein
LCVFNVAEQQTGLTKGKARSRDECEISARDQLIEELLTFPEPIHCLRRLAKLH